MSIRDLLLQWIARKMDVYVMQTFQSPAYDVPPPSLAHRASPGCTTGKRSYIKMSAEAAWGLMEDARESHTNLQQVAQLYKKDEAYGCCTTSSYRCMNIFNQLYYTRCQHGFRAEDVHHIQLVADPGTHSYK